MRPEPQMIRHPHGITTVDAMYVRAGFAAVHVIRREGRAAIIDTATSSAVPLVRGALEALGIAPGAVDTVFLTHVHLDHAGGAGSLLRELPNARVVVHPRGVAHLVDPSRLAGATAAVYGQERFDALYGTLVPIAADRIVETADLDRLRVGESELSVLHTPGHALHHQVLFDPRSAAIFAGDTLGVSYRAFDVEQANGERRAFIVPTTTPTQFDPAQLLASIDRLAALSPEAAYLTHFGRVTGIVELCGSLREQVAAFVQIALSHQPSSDRLALIRRDVRALWLERLERHDASSTAGELGSLLGDDLELNAQGLVAWLERTERSAECLKP